MFRKAEIVGKEIHDLQAKNIDQGSKPGGPKNFIV